MFSIDMHSSVLARPTENRNGLNRWTSLFVLFSVNKQRFLYEKNAYNFLCISLVVSSSKDLRA